MFHKLFKKDKQVIPEEDWISTLREDGIELTNDEIQKARENDGGVLCKIGLNYFEIKKDNAKAFVWLYKAARENCDPAKLLIGNMYRHGYGVSQDYRLAMEWYQRAATNGYVSAQNNIGSMYERGLGVSQDYQLAMEWYQKAASSGDTDSEYNIGYLYRDGLGVPQDYKFAMHWFQKAALKGDADAQNNIGYLYQSGLGVSQDYNLAMEWYQKAAKNGEPVSMSNIGELYEYGYGVTKNIDTAIEWYQKAVDKNYEPAKESLKRLTEKENDAKEKHNEKRRSSTHNVLENENSQPSAINHEEYISKLIDDKMKELANAFELKLGLAEKKNQANKESKEVLQRKFDILQQEQLRKDEENKQLRKKLARFEAQFGDGYNSSDSENAINYDTEIDDSDEEDTEIDNSDNINHGTKSNQDEHSVANIVNQNNNPSMSNEIYADPNYDSSDNEDLTKDLCLD